MTVKKPSVPTQKEIFSGKIDPIIKSNVISKNNDNYKDLRIGLYDIDSCLQYYFDNIIKPTVLENDVQISVPSMYGSPERWSSVQKDGYFRDKNGKIHCPVILFKRVGMSKDRNLSRNLDANFPRISKTFTKQYSSQNRYDAFSKLTNIKPTYEQHNIIIPDYVKLTYDCMIWTDYLVQLDKITEAISYAESSYWGDPEKFVFYATVSDFNNQTEVSDGQDRMVRCNFTINLNGYIISDALQKQLKEHSKNYTIQTLKLIESGFIPESDVSRPAVEPTVSSGGGNAYSRENAHAQYADFALSSSYSNYSAQSYYAAQSRYAETASYALSGTGGFTGSFTGSFIGDGSGLTNISASNIVGLNLSQISSGSFTASISPNFGLVVNTTISASSYSGSGDGLYNIPASGIVGLNLSQIVSGSATASISPNNGFQINVPTTGSTFSGSFIGDGNNLYNIPASGIVGLNLSQIASGSATASISPDGGLFINTNVTASEFSGSYVGDGYGLYNIPAAGIVGLNLSQIASGSATASISPNEGLKINIDTHISGGLNISGSLNVGNEVKADTFTGSLFSGNGSGLTNLVSSSYSLSGSYAVTSSYSISSSYAILAETASYIDTLYSSNHIGIFNDTDTWIVNHNLGTRFVIIQAFDSNYEQIIPSTIELTSTSSAKMTFPSNESGYSVTTVGGALGVVNVLSASFSDVATYAYRYDKPERRHDWQSPYSYMGYATHGTSVSESTWDLTRIEVYGAGTTDVKYATDSWNNHLIAIYN